MRHKTPSTVTRLPACAWRLRTALLAALCLSGLLSGCATTMESGSGSMSQLSMEYLDGMDTVVTEDGPVNVDGVELSAQEKTALNTPSELRWQLNDYARDAIKKEFVFLHYKRNQSINTWLGRSSRYLGYAKRVFRSQGLPEDLAYLPFIESGFNPTARSHAGAVGLWQFMPATGENHGLAYNRYLDERRNPWKATYAAASYLKTLYGMFGDWSLALAAYNAGEGKIGRACKATGATNFFELAMKNNTLTGKTKLKPETMHYVPRFIAMLKIANNSVALGYPALDERVRGEPKRHKIPPNLDLRALAKNVGMDWKAFRKLNAHFRTSVSPHKRSTHVYLPRQHAKQLAGYLSSPVKATAKSRARALAEVRTSGSKGSKQRAKGTVGDTKFWYKVQKGDTMAKISRKYRIPLRVLLGHNKKKAKDIKPGDMVAVPSYTRPVKSAPTPSAQKIAAAAKKKRGKKAPASTISYTVQAGDTLFSLARTHGCSVSALLKANGMRDATALRVGMTLKVPSTGDARTKAVASKPSTSKKGAAKKKVAAKSSSSKRTIYNVVQGDTIWSIARKFQVSPFKILEWNNMNTQSSLQPGDTIKVYVASN